MECDAVTSPKYVPNQADNEDESIVKTEEVPSTLLTSLPVTAPVPSVRPSVPGLTALLPTQDEVVGAAAPAGTLTAPQSWVSGGMKRRANSTGLMYIYLLFLATGSLVKETFPDTGLSTCLTLSVGMQLFALCCLRWRISEQRGVQGLSAKFLIMQSMVFGLRLMCSSWLRGYVPVDSTGDGLYQLLDFLALLLCLHMIYLCFATGSSSGRCIGSRHGCFETYRDTYQGEADAVEVELLILVCLVLAVLIHPDLNDRPLFDTLWAASLYIDAVAMVPQLWMMRRISLGAGGSSCCAGCGAAGHGTQQVVVSGHYLVGVACSRGANFLFWYHGYPELAPTDLTKMNIPGYAVITAHVIQFMLLVGFLIIYIANFPLCRIFTSLRGTRSPTTQMNGTAEDSKAGKSDAGEVGAELSDPAATMSTTALMLRLAEVEAKLSQVTTKEAAPAPLLEAASSAA